jgi:hypothetical protein
VLLRGIAYFRCESFLSFVAWDSHGSRLMVLIVGIGTRRVHVTQEDFDLATAKVLNRHDDKEMSLSKLWK